MMDRNGELIAEAFSDATAAVITEAKQPGSGFMVFPLK